MTIRIGPTGGVVFGRNVDRRQRSRSPGAVWWTSGTRVACISLTEDTLEYAASADSPGVVCCRMGPEDPADRAVRVSTPPSAGPRACLHAARASVVPDRGTAIPHPTVSSGVRRPSRRRFLAGGTASLALLAGCSTSRSSDAPGEATPAARTSATDVAAESTASPPSRASRTDERTDLFVSRLAAREFERAGGMLYATLGGDATGRLAATWRGLTIQHGPFHRHGIVDRGAQGDRSLRAVRLRFATDDQRLLLAFNPHGKVLWLDFPTRTRRPPDHGGRSFDVSLHHDDDRDAPLGATVTLPPGEDTVPGVVIVHRSGPHDRDGTAGPNRPYRDLAALFAAEGVASIRYDKRSFVYDLAKDEQSLENVVVADAVGAATRLGEEERVSDVILLGHGLGGVAAPRIARDTDVAGTVLAATPTRPLAEVYLDIERRKAAADGTVTHTERQRLDLFRENLALTGDLGSDDDYYVFGRATMFWRDLHALDVVRAVHERPEPTLALHPERGLVTTDADRAVWTDLLGHAGVRVYPALDHLFMRVFGESLPEAYFFPDTVATAVATDVAAWMRALVAP